MKVLFRSHNLLGDAVFASFAISRYLALNPDHEVTVETTNQWMMSLYSWIEPKVHKITSVTQAPQDYDKIFDLDIDKAWKLSQLHEKKMPIWVALGMNCGLDVRDMSRPPLVIPDIDIADEHKNRVVICPFSASCASRQGGERNKELREDNWAYGLEYLNRVGRPLVLCSSDQGFSTMHPQLDIWLRGYPLDYVANVLKHAKLVISVESGLAKLAIAQDVKTAILFPNILPLNVFAPVWSKNLKIAIVDVTTMEPPGLLLGLKQIIEQFHLE